MDRRWVMKYINVKVPKTLADLIDRIVTKHVQGYRSRGEFVTDAIRKQLKEHEEELSSSEERWRLLLESVSDGVFVITSEWRYILVNEEAARIVRLPREALLGNKMTDLFPGVEKTVFYKTYKKVMKSKEAATAFDRFVFPDGKTGWYQVHAYPVREGVLVIVADKTEEKLKEEALIRKHDEAYKPVIMGDIP